MMPDTVRDWFGDFAPIVPKIGAMRATGATAPEKRSRTSRFHSTPLLPSGANKWATQGNTASLVAHVARPSARMGNIRSKAKGPGNLATPQAVAHVAHIAQASGQERRKNEHEKGLGASDYPAEWIYGIARLLGMAPVADWPASSWVLVLEMLPGFMRTWAPQAAALGWGTLDLFGCHPQAPHSRLDQQGLALGLCEFEILAISERSAAVVFRRDRHGHRMTYYRRPVEVLAGAVPIWTIAQKCLDRAGSG